MGVPNNVTEGGQVKNAGKDEEYNRYKLADNCQQHVNILLRCNTFTGSVSGE